MKPEQIIMDFINRHTVLVDQCLPINNRERMMFAIKLLVKAGRIREWHHDCGLSYWTAACLPPRPLSNTSLARAFGILMFCHGSKSHSLITREELETYFPKVFRHGLPAGHYASVTSQSQRLGNVRVDVGQSKINRIVTRARRSIQQYEQQPGFRELIRHGNFELTWIVPTHSKQRRMIEALQPLTGSGIHLKVLAMPELLNVLVPIPQWNSQTS